MQCVFCGDKLNIVNKVGRRDTCPRCGHDLRCCKQCLFYEARAYNECKEIIAERVVDKDRANFCDYFIANSTTQTKVNRTQNAKQALEALFKKKA